MSLSPLSTEDCDFLLMLEEAGSVSLLCELKRLDKGMVSRKIARIHGLAPVLERVNGKWNLTSKGSELVQWYRNSSETQRRILFENTELKIGTTQVVSERKVTEYLDSIRVHTGFKNIRVITSNDDVETALLSRKIDCAWVCKVPLSPEIRYKKVFSSQLSVFVPGKWKKKARSLSELLTGFPCVAHTTMNIRELLHLSETALQVSATFDHLSGVREAAVSGIGWALLPGYSVEKEVASGDLVPFHKTEHFEEFKLWWVASRWKKTTIDQLLKSLSTSTD